ncbi:MAG: hypothetical protein AB4206_01440 [Xenococcaceae cyanobacterium]
MNNLSALKKNNSVSKQRLQIRNYLVSSVVFTIFALVCSHLVVKSSVENPYRANRLQSQLSVCHIIVLHLLSFSTLLGGNSSEKEEQ